MSENSQTSPSQGYSWFNLDNNVVSLVAAVKRTFSVRVKQIEIALDMLGPNSPSSALHNSILSASAR